MNIVQITPGAGKMICGACLRDSALVAALRKLGHSVLMVPLYLPLRSEQAGQSAEMPVFFSGLNVYLEQKSALFRRSPKWMRRLLGSRVVLNMIAGAAASTQPEDVGDTTLSILQGEQGKQAGELEELVAWLKTQKPDIVCLSNVLLIGLARRLKKELRVPVICSLQGEDSFLDGLPLEIRERAWRLVAERAAEVDGFIAPSQYFAALMQRRLGLPPERVHVVYNGIDLAGYSLEGGDPKLNPEGPVLGFFARMCPEKGLDTLVDAFIALRQRGRVQNLKLRVGGYQGPVDEAFVKKIKARLKKQGLLQQVEFCPNLSHAQKQSFLRSLSVFSVPARYSEAFGLYILEAMAAGIPVVEPDQSAFPELIDRTGGGVLFPPGNLEAFTQALERLLLDPAQARAFGQAGCGEVFKSFGVQPMAEQIARVASGIIRSQSGSTPAKF